MRRAINVTSRLTLTLLAALLLLQGCSNEYAENAKQGKTLVTAKITKLGTMLDNEQITNALLVKTYANKLAATKYDLRPIAEALSNDASSKGNLYQGLVSRVARVNENPENKAQFIPVIQELQSLSAASDPAIFNDALIDVVNTLADLSGGDLARINIPKDADSNKVKDGSTVPGSYLVGNPAYGRWQSSNNGRSFWVFYGQYRLFSDLLMGPSYYRGTLYYDSWYSHRRYSYYGDYGRGVYGSRSDRTHASNQNARMKSKGVSPAKPKKQYGSTQGRKRFSNYSTVQNNYNAQTTKKYGATNGGRHFNKSGKRTSNVFAGKTRTGQTSSTSPPRRTSSFFGSSSRSGNRSSRGFGGFGGK